MKHYELGTIHKDVSNSSEDVNCPHRKYELSRATSLEQALTEVKDILKNEELAVEIESLILYNIGSQLLLPGNRTVKKGGENRNYTKNEDDDRSDDDNDKDGDNDEDDDNDKGDDNDKNDDNDKDDEDEDDDNDKDDDNDEEMTGVMMILLLMTL